MTSEGVFFLRSFARSHFRVCLLYSIDFKAAIFLHRYLCVKNLRCVSRYFFSLLSFSITLSHRVLFASLKFLFSARIQCTS